MHQDNILKPGRPYTRKPSASRHITQHTSTKLESLPAVTRNIKARHKNPAHKHASTTLMSKHRGNKPPQKPFQPRFSEQMNERQSSHHRTHQLKTWRITPNLKREVAQHNRHAKKPSSTNQKEIVHHALIPPDNPPSKLTKRRCGTLLHATTKHAQPLNKLIGLT